MSDQYLAERFAHVAELRLAKPTAIADLAKRVNQRRTRRRATLAGGVCAAVLAAVAITVALRPGTSSSTRLHVVSRPPSTSPTTLLPTSIGSGPRLVIGWVPEGLSAQGCTHLPTPVSAPRAVACFLSIPTERGNPGVSITIFPRLADAALQDAWARRDAKTVAQSALGSSEGAHFIEENGGPVVATGNANHLFAILFGSDVVLVSSQGLTPPQLDKVLAGISTTPAPLDFSIPSDALPAGAHPVSQGPRRLWSIVDTLNPSRNKEYPGLAYGIDYEVPNAIGFLSVRVVRNVNATAYIDEWITNNAKAPGATLRKLTRNGRSGVVLDRPGADEAKGTLGHVVVLKVDPHSVVIVSPPTENVDAAVRIAAEVKLN